MPTGTPGKFSGGVKGGKAKSRYDMATQTFRRQGGPPSPPAPSASGTQPPPPTDQPNEGVAGQYAPQTPGGGGLAAMLNKKAGVKRPASAAGTPGKTSTPKRFF